MAARLERILICAKEDENPALRLAFGDEGEDGILGEFAARIFATVGEDDDDL